MEVDERPTKIRKIDHAVEVIEPPTMQEPGQTSGHSIGSNEQSDTSISNSGGIENQALKTETDSEKIQSNSINEKVDSSHPSSALVDNEGDQPKALSKNQQKKLRKRQLWEAKKPERKIKRKDQRNKKKARQKAAREAGDELPKLQKKHDAQLVPVTFIFDCSYDDLMHEQEVISLSGQLTRIYAENRRARFKTHLAVSSFGGRLKERFNTILNGSQELWQDFQFFDEDYVEVAEMAKKWMNDDSRGKVSGALASDNDEASTPEIVYLSSDSDNVITGLKPHSTYIIGGLVDRNRHKGVCYKSAMDRGMKTAKLPIGEYLEMSSRQVLTTNHVLEIMLRWLELGDWGKAFVDIIPKRKGGVLRDADKGLERKTDERAEVDSLVIEPSPESSADEGPEKEDEVSAPLSKQLDVSDYNSKEQPQP